jgi:Putative beta-barrel porin-2, OmpL-like. bbp2
MRNSLRVYALAWALGGAASTALAQQPDTTKKPAPPTPFGFADFTWVNGNGRAHSSPLDTKYFTPEIRVDVNYVSDFNRPKDHTIDGSSEVGRSSEIQLQQLGLGGDFHYQNIRARVMTQFGLYSTETPRNDASPSRGQWDLTTAYRYFTEAYGGYHFDVMDGINVDVGIFLSYIGLFSYYNADNWAYQPSYVSANTPWFFNGARVQMFPSQHLKVEFWLINGWQSYGTFNSQPGLGTEILWRPNGSLSLLTNNYWGYDTFGAPSRARLHTDNSILYKYYDSPNDLWDKSALSFTFDAGCENGGHVQCATAAPGRPQQYFLGFMLYDRNWFAHDRFGITLGGGAINNPGRYLVLLPPINGATATSGSPYFTENPGDQYHAWDASVTFDWAPNDFFMFRIEPDRRAASVPYFVGRQGVTPPGGNNGNPAVKVAGWAPDLVKAETRVNVAVLVKL